MKCGQCGYDMSGTPEACKCPECASTEWRREPATWSAAEWWGLGFGVCPLIWVGLVHLLLIVARGTLGRWPHRGGADDPKGVPIVGDVHGLVLTLGVVFLLTPLVTLMLSAFMYFYARQSGRLAAGLLLRGLGLWFFAIVIAKWDPVLAMMWFFD